MAKKRVIIGNITKKKDGGSRYIKVNLAPSAGKSVTLTSGMYINLETNEEQLASAERAVEEGKLSEEVLGEIQARVEKDAKYGAIGRAYVTVEE